MRRSEIGPWAQSLITLQAWASRVCRISVGDSDSRSRSRQDGDEAPETPLDEPRPPRIQDPPPQPAPKGRMSCRPTEADTEAQQ